jgi:hypothetical protein
MCVLSGSTVTLEIIQQCSCMVRKADNWKMIKYAYSLHGQPCMIGLNVQEFILAEQITKLGNKDYGVFDSSGSI